jgi:hypothetical protein
MDCSCQREMWPCLRDFGRLMTSVRPHETIYATSFVHSQVPEAGMILSLNSTTHSLPRVATFNFNGKQLTRACRGSASVEVP